MAAITEGERMQAYTSPLTSVLSYFVSFSLVVGSVFDFLNDNAGAFGVLFAAITCGINYKAKRAMLMQFKDNGMRRRKTDFVD